MKVITGICPRGAVMVHAQFELSGYKARPALVLMSVPATVMFAGVEHAAHLRDSVHKLSLIDKHFFLDVFINISFFFLS